MLALAACGNPSNGAGRLDAVLAVDECRPGGDLPRSPYGWDAGHLGTKRFENTLRIRMQEFRVDLEETDGVDIRVGDLNMLRDRGPAPFEVPLGRGRDDINVALNLFTTCPDRPTLHASGGVLSFTEFQIREDPENTGKGEAVAGTLTATVVAVDGSVAGTMFATFDFAPTKRPVSEPR